MPQLFLEGAARPLLVLHALLALALGGASTHLAIIMIRVWRGRAQPGRLVRMYSRTIGALFVIDFVLGLLVYPTYRYYVRGLYFDRYEPWAANLFDLKEILLGLGLPLALGVFAVCGFGSDETSPERRAWAASLSLLLWILIAFGIVSGLTVTTVRSV
jgi:hypothetical protein